MYMPLIKGYLDFVAIMDLYSRWVLVWRLSNTLDATRCTEARDEVLALCGPPEILNTDQGIHLRNAAHQ
jgi:putative transposase